MRLLCRTERTGGWPCWGAGHGQNQKRAPCLQSRLHRRGARGAGGSPAVLERGCRMLPVPRTPAPGATGARGTGPGSEEHPLPRPRQSTGGDFGFRPVAKSDPRIPPAWWRRCVPWLSHLQANGLMSFAINIPAAPLGSFFFFFPSPPLLFFVTVEISRII